MIVLDTNVLSVLMRAPSDKHVASWLDTQPAEQVWTTSITVFEVHFGLLTLPSGRRRTALQRAFDALLTEDLDGRVFVFDQAAAVQAAAIAARLKTLGRPVDIRDIQIGGIVAARQAALATGNTRHFQHMSIALIDPWRPADAM